MPTPVDIYIAFAPQDGDACTKFEQHLATFVSRGALRVLHRLKLNAGDNLETSLNQYFAQAQIIVFLRTIHFENDARCKQEEEWAYQALKTKKVISVIVRDHNWHKTREYSLGFVHLPRNGRSVENGPNHDAAWTEVAREIYEVVKHISAPHEAQAYAAPTPSHAQYHPHAPTPLVVQPRQTYVAYPQAASRPKQNTHSILIGIVCLCLFGIAIYSYASTKSPPETPSTTEATTSTARQLPNQCPSPCCGGVDCTLNADELRKLCPDSTVPCCPSGRKCVTLGCGERLSASQPYKIRLAHAFVNGREPSINGQVCFLRVGSGAPRQCVPYSSAHANSNNAQATPAMPIPIFLGDILTGKGLEVEIWEYGQSWPVAQFRASHDHIKATALCIGLKLAQSGNPDTKVLFFLDDL